MRQMKNTTLRLLAVLSLVGLGIPLLRAGEEVKIQPDVVYGHKDGLALTFDVIKPAAANGAGILWLQSGGWYSTWVDPKGWPTAAKHFLDKGFTVFIVRHGSAPKYTIPEATEDVRRSVRFIRMKAKEFGVDPQRLGVTGGSAGGHLSLMLATTGDDGDPRAKDEVLKQSSRVAAAVALFPPTDIRGWTSDPPEAIKKIPTLKPPLSFDEKKTPDYSPALKVTDQTAPSLLIHGDKDELVPIEHSRKMLEALEKAKAIGKLVVVEGAAHGFSDKQNRELVRPAMLDWFEKHLAAKKEP
jgi:acetyl esterase/lipase